jgi:hypothetical protein
MEFGCRVVNTIITFYSYQLKLFEALPSYLEQRDKAQEGPVDGAIWRDCNMSYFIGSELASLDLVVARKSLGI